MQEIILIVYLVVAIALVGIILIQQGKGAEMGASFGAGGANTVFGAAGSGNALTKTTTILAILFFAIALSISYLNSEPKIIKDEIFDAEPAATKIDVNSELPPADVINESLEAAPPTDAASDAIDASEPADSKAAEADSSKAATQEPAAKEKTEETKKDGGNQ